MAFPLTIKTLYGLEDILAEELKMLGASNISIGNRVVQAEGDMELLYKANYQLRTALRVLVPIAHGKINNQQELYKLAFSINWGEYFSYLDDFVVEATSFSPDFTHSGFIALKVKDAIADQFREKHGKRPSVNKVDPKMHINVHLNVKDVTISLDSSGAPLFKRSYKTVFGQAPLNEVLAAGLVLRTGWRGETDFYDFMCGSGTLLTEAALIAHQLPANYYRKHFGFKNWRNYDARLWHHIVKQARKNKIKPDIHFYGNDNNEKALNAAQKNTKMFYFSDKFVFSRKDFVDVRPAGNQGVIVTNPPYGERLKEADINNFYKQMGNHLKTHFPGFDAWILSNNTYAIKHIGLRSKQRKTVFNGGLKAKFIKFPLKSGNFS